MAEEATKIKDKLFQLESALNDIITGSGPTIDQSSVVQTINRARIIFEKLLASSDIPHSGILKLIQVYWNRLNDYGSLKRFKNAQDMLCARNFALEMIESCSFAENDMSFQRSLIICTIVCLELSVQAQKFEQGKRYFKSIVDKMPYVMSDASCNADLFINMIGAAAKYAWKNVCDSVISEEGKMELEFCQLLRSIKPNRIQEHYSILLMPIAEELKSIPVQKWKLERATKWTDLIISYAPKVEKDPPMMRLRAMILSGLNKTEAIDITLELIKIDQSYSSVCVYVHVANTVSSSLPSHTSSLVWTALSHPTSLKEKLSLVSSVEHKGFDDEIPDMYRCIVYSGLISLHAGLEGYLPAHRSLPVRPDATSHDIIMCLAKVCGSEVMSDADLLDMLHHVLSLEGHGLQLTHSTQGGDSISSDTERETALLLSCCGNISIRATQSFEAQEYERAIQLWQYNLRIAQLISPIVPYSPRIRSEESDACVEGNASCVAGTGNAVSYPPPNGTMSWRDREQARVLRCLSVAALRSGLLEKADEYLDSAMALESDSSHGLFIRVLVCLARGDPRATATALSKLCRLRPRPTLDMLATIAKEAWERKDVDVCIRALEHLVEFGNEAIEENGELYASVLRNLICCVVSEDGRVMRGGVGRVEWGQVVASVLRTAGSIPLSGTDAEWWWGMGWNTACGLYREGMKSTSIDTTERQETISTVFLMDIDRGMIECANVIFRILGRDRMCGHPVPAVRRIGAMFMYLSTAADLASEGFNTCPIRQQPESGEKVEHVEGYELIRMEEALVAFRTIDELCGEVECVSKDDPVALMVKSPRFPVLLRLLHLAFFSQSPKVVDEIAHAEGVTPADLEATACRMLTQGKKVLARILVRRALDMLVPPDCDSDIVLDRSDAERCGRLLRGLFLLRDDESIEIVNVACRIVSKLGSLLPRSEIEALIGEVWNTGTTYYAYFMPERAERWLEAAIRIGSVASPPYESLPLLKKQLEVCRADDAIRIL